MQWHVEIFPLLLKKILFFFVIFNIMDLVVNLAMFFTEACYSTVVNSSGVLGSEICKTTVTKFSSHFLLGKSCS